MAFTLMKDRVLVKIKEGERKLPSGIILPEQKYNFKRNNDAGTRAIVIAVGPWQNEVEPGDEVVIEKFGGVEVSIANDDFVILEGSEILAIIENDNIEWTGKAIQLGIAG